MRPLRVVLLVALFPLSTFAADRYWIATRSAPRVAPLRLLQDSDESRRHAVHAFESVDAFAADLNIDEVVSLKRSPDVRYVSPLVPRYASGDDSRPPLSANGSPYLSSQTVPYGVTMIHANDLWRFTRGGGGAVNIAIMDTGIDVRHPDLAPNFAGGYNTFSPSDQPIDDNGHGTHVAGTIAAIDNNFGVVGVAPQARIWSVKCRFQPG